MTENGGLETREQPGTAFQKKISKYSRRNDCYSIFDKLKVEK